MRVFGKASFDKKFPYYFIYPTTHDAVLEILRARKPPSSSNFDTYHSDNLSTSSSKSSSIKSISLNMEKQSGQSKKAKYDQEEEESVENFKPVYIEKEKSILTNMIN
jgi:hypothetical protein